MDTVADITVEILRGIRDKLEELAADTKARFEAVHARFEEMNARFDERLGSLTHEVRSGFAGTHARIDATNTRIDATNTRIDATNTRIDGVIAIVGKHHGELEDRVTRIEQHLSLR